VDHLDVEQNQLGSGVEDGGSVLRTCGHGKQSRRQARSHGLNIATGSEEELDRARRAPAEQRAQHGAGDHVT
jgi:hypothetical protein